jgi:hypothetical protein
VKITNIHKCIHEWQKKPEKKGFEDIARTFDRIAAIEKYTKKDIKTSRNVEKGTVFKKIKKFSGNAETVDISMKNKSTRAMSNLQASKSIF